MGIEDLFVVSVGTDFGRTMERVSVCLICEQQVSERNSIGGESSTEAPSFGRAHALFAFHLGLHKMILGANLRRGIASTSVNEIRPF